MACFWVCTDACWEIRYVLESSLCQTRMHLDLRVDRCVQQLLVLRIFLFLF